MQFTDAHTTICVHFWAHTLSCRNPHANITAPLQNSSRELRPQSSWNADWRSDLVTWSRQTYNATWGSISSCILAGCPKKFVCPKRQKTKPNQFESGMLKKHKTQHLLATCDFLKRSNLAMVNSLANNINYDRHYENFVTANFGSHQRENKKLW